MGAVIPEDAKKLVDGRNYATVTTLNPDGAPQSSVVWITHDGDDLVFSATTVRQKYRNLLRDPRLSVVVFGPDVQQRYLEVRGTAEITENGGRELINSLYNKYIGEGDYPWDTPDAVRVVVRVKANKVNWPG